MSRDMTTEEWLEELDSWMDKWCCTCPILAEDVCGNCIIRYLDAWKEEQRAGCARN